MFFALLFLAVPQSPKDGPDAAQFLRLVKAAVAPMRDVTFTFEGEFRYVGPPERVVGGPKVMDDDFQGLFAYRSDGSMHILNYTKPVMGGSMKKSIEALLHDDLAISGYSADAPRPAGKPRRMRSVPGQLFRGGSPTRIFFPWLYLSYDDIAERHYEFQGWELLSSRT